MDLCRFVATEDDGLVGEEREKRGVPDAVALLLELTDTTDRDNPLACCRDFALAQVAKKHQVYVNMTLMVVLLSLRKMENNCRA